MLVADSDNKPPSSSRRLFYSDTVVSVRDSCLLGLFFLFLCEPLRSKRWSKTESERTRQKDVFAAIDGCVLLTVYLSWFVCVHKYGAHLCGEKDIRPVGRGRNRREKGETDDKAMKKDRN